MRVITNFFGLILRFLRLIPKDFWFIIGLFLVSRILLTMIGYASWRFFGSITTGSLEGVWQFSHDTSWLAHPSPLLSVWGHWDTKWYLKIAEHGYLGADRFGLVFFPLFPLVSRIVGSFTGGDLYVAGLLVNNIAVITSLWYLYVFCKERWGRDVALRAAKYLIIFPTSFYLSGYLTESLFVMLSIMTFYYAYKRQWVIAGPLAGLLAISRPVGVLVIVPLLLLYLQEHWDRPVRQRVKELMHLAWIPLAFGAFIVLQWKLSSEWFVIAKFEELGWHRHFVDPITFVRQGLVNFTNRFLLLTGLTPYLVLAFVREKLGGPLLSWGVLAMLPAILTGLVGLPRYIVAVFPMYIAIALLTKSRKVDELLMVSFSICQGVLMVLWVINAPFLQ